MGTLAFLSQLLLLALGVFLMIVILLQRGRGGGLAGAFGGLGGQSAFGTKAGDVFTKITIVMAVLWVVVAGSSGLLLRDAAEVRAQGLGDVQKEDDALGGVSSGDELIDESADDEAMAPATDDAPVDGTPADNTPADDAPADDASTDETPAAETPGTKTPATDATGDNAAPPKPADAESETDAAKPETETPAADAADSDEAPAKPAAESTPETNPETSDE